MVVNKLRFFSVVGGLGLGLVTLLGACSGALKPGDYRVYKMDFQTAAKGNGCYFPSPGPDPNSGSDSDTTLSSSTWVMTTDSSANFFLDVGDHTLQGKVADKGFTFTSRKVDVQYEGDDATKTKTTTTVDTQIAVTLDGKSIGGTAVVTTSFGCSGANCMVVPPSCVVSIKFSGDEVDDVELQYGVK
jgi:hypothetical protein